MKRQKTAIFHAAQRVLLSVLLCVLFPSVTAQAAEERQTIRVGFYAFDGYHMMDEEGNHSGYGYDLVRLMARYMDVDFEYVGYDKGWNSMLDMLENGEIDFVSATQFTPERAERFAFTLPVGSSDAMLTARADNTEIIAGAYKTYDGKRIGLLQGNSCNEDLERLAADNSFTYEAVYFEKHTDLEKALQIGSVDAAMTSSLRQTNNEKVLENFAAQQFYGVVRKDDTALLEQINYAIQQMNNVEGDWKTELNNKYYFHQENKDLTFTEEEQALIAEYASGEKTLVITASTDRAPYSYAENGELKGILADYFAKLADFAGIPYEIKLSSSREEYQAWQSGGEVDGFLDARVVSPNFMEQNSYSYTAPYTTMHVAMVTRRDFDGEIDRLAVAVAQGTFGIEDGLVPNAERVMVESREEGLRAVQDGDADAIFVYLYTAQQYVNSDQKGLLTYTLMEEPVYEYCIAFSSEVDHRLSGIFTKAIYAIPDGTLEDLATQYTSYRAEEVDLATWVTIHPFPSLLIIAGFFLSCVMLLLYRQRQQVLWIEQKRSRQLEELAEEATRANRAKSDFLANVSHDIRTPMNAIVGIADLISHDGETSEKTRSYVRKIQSSSRHLLALIDDVLDMSRIEAQKVTLSPEPISLKEQVRQVEVIIRQMADNHGHTLRVRIFPMKHDCVVADGTRLQQVLLNLLSNAVKYTQDGGKIDFSMEELPCGAENQMCCRFTVQDNGYGMSQEFLQHIFEPFVRSEASCTNKIQGTGLGMAITKSIVDMMGGSIVVESELLKGSCFTVTLTLPVSEQKLTDASENEGLHDILQGMRFLCAEDNALNAEILQAMLQSRGADCVIYSGGKALLAAFTEVQEGDFDAILMDVQMPEMNGLETAFAIRSSENPLGKTIPIIALSANAFTEDVQRSLAAGMNAHISKPLDMEVLEKTVWRLIKTGKNLKFNEKA